MEKTFKQGEIYLIVSTNMLKEGQLYFGEKDIEAEFEAAVKSTTYNRPKDMSNELLLVEVYKKLQDANIKPKSIYLGALRHSGTKMTETKNQIELPEE